MLVVQQIEENQELLQEVNAMTMTTELIGYWLLVGMLPFSETRIVAQL